MSTLKAVHDAYTQIPHDEIQSNIDEIEQAIDIHVLTGSLEAELNARLLLADLFELAEDLEAAKSIASIVLPKAQAMNYGGLVARAKAHLTGDTLLTRAESRRIQISGTDPDYLISSHDDTVISQIARSTLDALKLPLDRLPVLERSWIATRFIAMERLHWCQHIQLLEELGHMNHPATRYQRDPKCHGFCSRYNYESAIGLPDPTSVIAAFKKAYCNQCTSREPKLK